MHAYPTSFRSVPLSTFIRLGPAFYSLLHRIDTHYSDELTYAEHFRTTAGIKEINSLCRLIACSNDNPDPDAERAELTDHFIKLSCSNCGGALEVYDDMDQFACGYCGAKLLVQRRGGTVILSPAEVLHKIQVGTDKAAADLAVARLTEERQKLVKRSEAPPDERFRRTKWGFGIGGALLLIGIVASRTVKNLKSAKGAARTAAPAGNGLAPRSVLREFLKAGPVRRTELPPGLALRVETLRSVLAEVCPMTTEQWLDNLRRDLNPEKEVLWWERVAGCFTAFVAKRAFSPYQRQAVFKIVCGLCSGLRERDLAADLALLSESDLIELAVSVRSVAH